MVSIIFCFNNSVWCASHHFRIITWFALLSLVRWVWFWLLWLCAEHRTSETKGPSHRKQNYYLMRNDKLKNTPGKNLQIKMSGSVRGGLGWEDVGHILRGEGVPAQECSERLVAVRSTLHLPDASFHYTLQHASRLCLEAWLGVEGSEAKAARAEGQ